MERDVPTPAPVICAEFDFGGYAWLTVFWPGADDEDDHFDTVRADLPFIWRNEATYSEDFNG